MDLPPSAECRGSVLDPARLAGQGDLAVEVEPELLVPGHQLAHAPAGRLPEAALTLESRVGLDEQIVDRAPRGVEEHFDDAKTGLDRLEQGAIALFAGAQRSLGMLSLGDVVAHDEDAGRGTLLVDDGLIDEIDEALVGRRLRACLHHIAGVARMVGHARAIDAIQKRDIALRRGLGQRLGHGLAENIAPADHPVVGRIGQREAMLRSLQERHEARRLAEDHGEALAPRYGFLLRHHLRGRLGAHHQHTADPVGRGLVVDRAVAVGPVDVLKRRRGG